MIRIVKLTDEQRDIVSNHANQKRAISDILAEMLYKLGEIEARQDTAFWEQMYEIAHVDPNIYKITVNYISGSLKIEERDEQ